MQTWLTRFRNHPKSDPNEATWFEAVIANRARRPYEALDLLGQLDLSTKSGSRLYEEMLLPAKDMRRAILNDLRNNLEKAEAIDFGMSPGKENETAGSQAEKDQSDANRAKQPRDDRPPKRD